MSTIVEPDWKTLSYSASGTLWAKGGYCTVGGGGGPYPPAAWAGSLEVTCCFGALYISPEYDLIVVHHYGELPEDDYDEKWLMVRWRFYWLFEDMIDQAYTAWYQIGYLANSLYPDQWQWGEASIAWTLSVQSSNCDLVADWSDASGQYTNNIYDGRLGYGAELCKAQGVSFGLTYDNVAISISGPGISVSDSQSTVPDNVSPSQGIYLNSEFVGWNHRMPAGSLALSASYSSFNGSSDVSRSHNISYDPFSYSGTVGAGTYSYSWTSSTGQFWLGFEYPTLNGPSLRDYCCKTNVPGGRCDIRYMWEGSRNPLQDNWVIHSTERHPVGQQDGNGFYSYTWPDSGLVNLNASNPDLTYGGAWTAGVPYTGTDKYRDTPQDPGSVSLFNHGNAYIDGLAAEGSPPVESFEGEPAHPVWTPLPGEGEPDYLDDSLYIKCSKLSMPDVMRITVPAEGSTYASPLVFADVSGWDGTGCTVTTDADGLKITTTQPDAICQITKSEGLAAGVWLNGRFSKVRWKCSLADAGASIKIGPHTWNLTGGAAGAWNETQIDLLRPDSTDSPVADCQSIIPYELPDQLVLNGTWAHDDATAGWEMPAGWGISRLTSVVLTLANNGAIYHFDKISLTRKAASAGGFAKLYVLPHQASWNDDRDVLDYALESSGRRLVGSNWLDYYVYRKALLVIDGAVVAEIIAGWIEDGPLGYRSLFTDLQQAVYVWPLKDYADLINDPENAELATPGVTRQTVIASTVNEFLLNLLYTWALVPGIYTPDGSNVIKVSVDVPVRVISYPCGLNASDLITGYIGRWRGQACGLLWRPDGSPAVYGKTVVKTLDASSGHVTNTTATANKLGWWESGPLNTKGDGEFSGPDDGRLLCAPSGGDLLADEMNGKLLWLLDRQTRPLRNRHLMRVV